jgi:hypothetical protein
VHTLAYFCEKNLKFAFTAYIIYANKGANYAQKAVQSLQKNKKKIPRKTIENKIFFNQTIYKTKNYAYEKPFKQM